MSKGVASKNKAKKGTPPKKRSPWPVIIGVVVVIVLISAGALVLTQKSKTSTTATTSVTGTESGKLIILYVDQGNALVDTSNYTTFLNFAKANGFNTVFFQIYRSGDLLFSQSDLTYFVNTAHLENLKIYFSLYFTASSQLIPTSIYTLGEDGINLDMSTLSDSAQSNLLATLQQNYKQGKTAITTTNFTTTLKPDILVLETYSSTDQSYIHSGIVAGVEPLALSTKQEYTSQYQYALSNSDGVMVFDYYGLLKTGY